MIGACHRSRETLRRLVNEQPSETDRLALEAHLSGCAECRAEAARLQLFGVLRAEPPRLGDFAHRRILQSLVAVQRDQRPVAARRRGWFVPAALSLSVAAAAVVVLVALRDPPPAPLADAAEVEPGDAALEVLPTPADHTRTTLARPTKLSFAGSRVRATQGTSLELHAEKRTVKLVEGRIDVDVTPGGPGHYRVETKRFTIDVLGTRFVVTPEGVRIVRGKVRVLGPDGAELAVLVAGQAWQVEAPPIGPVAAAPSEPAPAPVAPVRAPSRTRAAADSADPLDAARDALAAGDVAKARELVAGVRRSSANRGVRAEADMLLADALLGERRYDEAIDAYREAARRHSGLGAGEAASFALAQVLAEQGKPDEAASALEQYLATYPSGRFVREAREHQHRLQSPRP